MTVLFFMFSTGVMADKRYDHTAGDYHAFVKLIEKALDCFEGV